MLLIVGGSVYIVEKGGYLRSEASAFVDVPSSHWAFSFIKKSNEIGLFKGCAQDRFCPDDPLTRAQAAIVAVRFLDKQVSNPSQVFSDVPVGHQAFNEIKLIKDLGITSGCGAGNYCPEAAMTRGQAAVFIIRAMELKKPGSTSVNSNFTSGISQGFNQQFSDVPQNHIFFPFIEKMRVLGITSGCGNNKYCLDNPISRAEAAVFWVRAYEIIFPPTPAPTKTPPPTKIPQEVFPKLSKVEVSAIPNVKRIKPRLDALKDGDKYKISVFKRETNLLFDLPIGRERITTVWTTPDGEEVIPFDLNRYGEIQFTVSRYNKRGDYVLKEVQWKDQKIILNQKLKVVDTPQERGY